MRLPATLSAPQFHPHARRWLGRGASGARPIIRQVLWPESAATGRRRAVMETCSFSAASPRRCIQDGGAAGRSRREEQGLAAAIKKRLFDAKERVWCFQECFMLDTEYLECFFWIYLQCSDRYRAIKDSSCVPFGLCILQTTHLKI